MFRYTLALLITLSSLSLAAAQPQAGERETIGLVLAGGGARGIAHGSAVAMENKHQRGRFFALWNMGDCLALYAVNDPISFFKLGRKTKRRGEQHRNKQHPFHFVSIQLRPADRGRPDREEVHQAGVSEGSASRGAHSGQRGGTPRSNAHRAPTA